MAFIDNPIISALGNELGLGGVFAAASGQPPDNTASPEGSYPVKPGMSKPNIPPYRNRPYIPRPETQGRTGGVSPGGAPEVAPGTMDPSTLQDPNVRAMLGQYGVTPSTTPPDPNLFLHNPQAFANHPVLSGLLERGLEGLAYSHPGGNFLQSLVGGVQGMGQANAARAEQVNAQTMAPVQQAQQIAGLQKLGDEHQTAQAEIQYHQAMAKAATQNSETRRDHAAAIPPRKNTDGTSSTWNPDTDKWEVDSSLGVDQEMAHKNAYYVGAAHDLAAKKYNGDLTQLTGQDHANIIANFEKQQSLAKGASSQLVEGQRAATTLKAAGIRAGGEGKISPKDKLQYQDLNSQDAELGRRLNEATNAKSLLTDESGNLVVPGSKAHKAYLGRLQARRANVQAAKQAITGGGSIPAAPTLSPNNPFAHPQNQ